MTTLFIVLRVFPGRTSFQLQWTVFPVHSSPGLQSQSPTADLLRPKAWPSPLNSTRVRKASGNLGRCIISPHFVLATLHIAVGLPQSLGCIPAGFCLPVLWQEKPLWEAECCFLSPTALCWHQCCECGFSTAVAATSRQLTTFWSTVCPKLLARSSYISIRTFFFKAFTSLSWNY